MVDLQVFRIDLRFREPLALIGNGAEAAKGLLEELAEVREDDSQGSGRPLGPFSISPLHVDDERRVLAFEEGSRAWFEVGAMRRELVESLSQFGGRRRLSRRLGGVKVEVNSIAPILDRGLTYESLFDFHAPPSRIELRFLSPTVLDTGRSGRLFPTPEAVFGSLLTRFNQTSPFRFPVETLEELSRLWVSRYNLRTTRVDFGRFKVVGFLGQVSYNVPHEMTVQMAYLAGALARFARVSGVGARTMQGLGQVEGLLVDQAEER